MSELLHLDFESRSAVSLDVRGLHNYVTDKSTEVLMAAYAFGEGKTKLWQPHLEPEMPTDLREALLDPFTQVAAWNCTFERAILKYVLGIDKPIQEFVDPSVQARYLSIPGSLAQAGKILGLKEDQAKDKDGDRLIALFCEPTCKGGEEGLFGTTQAGFRDWTTDPADWELFCEYCRRDIIAERVIAKKMSRFPVPQSEIEMWWLDQKINEIGLVVDGEMVAGANDIVLRTTAHLSKKLKDLTGLSNPNSTDQMLGWLKERGYPFGSLGKPFVVRALGGEGELTDEAREAIAIREQTSKSSVRKYTSIGDTVSADGRLRHQFSFMGASRTGRWASRGINLQNLPRPIKSVEKKMTLALDLLRKRDLEGIEREFSNPLDVVTSTLRSAFHAPKGKKLVVCDLNAIENRVIGYVARCPAILNVFYENRCPYLDFAVELYGRPYEELHHEWKVLKITTTRNNAKPASLGCFGGDTLVLTDAGWLPIKGITIDHRVWDGTEFVEHQGLIDQGFKEIINLEGVEVTPDHLIYVEGKWVEACDVAQSTQLVNQAIGSVNGLSSELKELFTKTERKLLTISAIATYAKQRRSLINRTWSSERQNLVSRAPTRVSEKRWEAFMNSLTNQEKSLIESLIDTMQSYPGVEESVLPLTGMQGEELPVNLNLFTSLSGIASLYRDLTSNPYRSTEKTMTGTTQKEISGSSLLKSTTETRRIFNTSCGKEKDSLPWSSGNDIAQSIENLVQFAESCEKGLIQLLSSRSKTTAEVRTYDIQQTGDKNRFTILTSSGPMIVHNCGFRLSAGEECVNEKGDQYRSGLMGYAEAMSIEMTKEEAERAVQIFRKKYPEVVQLWYDTETAAIAAVENPGQWFGVGNPVNERDRQRYLSKGKNPDLEPILSFKCTGKTLLEMKLPSGRSLHYIHPLVHSKELEGKNGPYTKKSVSYEGKDSKTKAWVRDDTHGGKWVENGVQAIARDILCHGLKKANEMGFEIILHVHDEIGALQSKSSPLGLPQLEECMKTPPDWAKGMLPLGAEGYEHTTYKKG